MVMLRCCTAMYISDIKVLISIVIVPISTRLPTRSRLSDM